jgi:two-component system phosphate regulon sensor histidine kinase PhoR
VALICAVLLTAWLSRRRKAASFDHDSAWAALEHAPFGLLLLDSPDCYRYANAQARRLLGLAASAGALPQEDWLPLLRADRAAVRQAVAATGRYGNVSLSAHQAVRWWVVPWRDLDVVYLLDVTAQQRAEQASSYLLSDLSHELRTPLATILTHLEVLLLPDLDPEVEGRSLRLLKTEARRMARLVNDMLELGRLETTAEIERRPVDLLALAEQAIARLAPQAREREIALSLRADAPLAPVVGDRDRLLQVLLNLLDNAVKYSRPGDQVEVAVRRREGAVECSVRDTGPGILPEHLPHVMRRFYRAAPQDVEGSGLGLALVEEILHRHGTELEMHSEAVGEATGTRASFSLPLLAEEAAE